MLAFQDLEKKKESNCVFEKLDDLIGGLEAFP
jgi:hypothetical protein